ncbi:NAD(P)-dependent alcohol dehydrogenase [Glycomyces halotolerans]
MRAVVQRRYGAPEQVLEPAEVDRPEPGPGKVLIRVRAASVNTPDWIAVTGTPYVLRAKTGLRRPAAPIRGTDVAGVVEAVGADVADLAAGDEVFGSSWDGGFGEAGTFAEYTVAPAAQLARKPAGIGFAEAACSVMSGLTALATVRDTGVAGPGRSVLINGASGGVGTFAVQIARHLGADVTGVCGPSNADLVRTLGADHVIDYTTTDFTSGEARFDLIVDNVMNHPPRRTARALAAGGVLVPNSIGTSGRWLGSLPRMAAAAVLARGRTTVRFAGCDYTRANLEAIGELVESGAVKVVLDGTFELDHAPQAVARMLSHRARGNIAVTVD